MTSYADAVLRAEVQNVGTAPIGKRSHILNVASYNLGLLVWAGTLGHQMAEMALLTAARQAGLDDHDALTTIRSGFRAATK